MRINYLAPGFDSAKEESLLLAVNPKVHISGRSDVIKEHRVPLCEPLGECLSPIARFVRQVWTSVSWQTAA